MRTTASVRASCRRHSARSCLPSRLSRRPDPLPPLRGGVGEGEAHGHEQVASPSPPSPASGGGSSGAVPCIITTTETEGDDMTITRIAALLLLAGLAAPAHAQTYPERPIKLIVPISVGSITDIATRLVAQELQARLRPPGLVL